MARNQFLMTWRNRPGIDEGEFEDWIRSAEYATFRRQPEILRHTVWKIAESINGQEQFTHFALIEVAERADLDLAMLRPELVAHEAQWIESYSYAGPDADDPAENWHASYSQEIWG